MLSNIAGFLKEKNIRIFDSPCMVKIAILFLLE